MRGQSIEGKILYNQNQIQELQYNINQLQYERERNIDLYGEGYGNASELKRCLGKIDREMARSSKKMNSLNNEIYKLQQRIR